MRATDDEELGRLLEEQRGYYRALAADDLNQGLELPGGDEVTRALDAFQPTGSVLELACGPGVWTGQLLRHATEVTAIDASPEMLAIAAARVGDQRVRFVEADLFTWQPDRRYDVVFFGFWLSHVPAERFAAFWSLVAACLKPGGRVFFADDAYRTPDELVEGPSSSTIRRQLPDGTPYRLVKVPHRPADLERRLRQLGWRIKVTPTAGPFYWGAGSPGTQLDDDRYHRELQALTLRLAEAAHDADPAQPVPTCPAWTLAQLTAHVGFGHRWAAVIVERRATTPVPPDQVDDLQVPAAPEERRRWLLAGARRLSDAVRRAGPQTRVWTWADDQTAGFWLRRITHDTLVHCLDAELAVGREVGLASDLAADSVSDLLDMFSILPRIDDFPALAELRGSGQTLHFQATDPGLGPAGEWLARRLPSGVTWEHGHGSGDAALRGRALDLLLVLSRRAPLGGSRVEASGDPGLLAHWLEHSRLEPA